MPPTKSFYSGQYTTGQKTNSTCKRITLLPITLIALLTTISTHRFWDYLRPNMRRKDSGNRSVKSDTQNRSKFVYQSLKSDSSESEDDNVYQTNSKRSRLTANKVRLLENSFLENMKLNPERKEKLSIQLGISARQIAIWFQNRRSRWKSQQLEDEHEDLKKDYNDLLSEHDELTKDHNVLKVRCDELHSRYYLLEKQMILLQNSVERSNRSNQAHTSLLEVQDRPNQVPNLNRMDHLIPPRSADLLMPSFSCNSDASTATSGFQNSCLASESVNFVTTNQTLEQVLDLSALLSPFPIEPLEDIVWPQSDSADFCSQPFLNDLLDPETNHDSPRAFFQLPFSPFDL